MRRERYDAACALLGDATPLQKDCGTLCGAACCLTDEEGKGGVCLMDCEAERLKEVNWAEIEPNDALMDSPVLMCRGLCEREKRPFLCRIFPLCPVFDEEGRFRALRMDARARAVCPLASGGVKGLDRRFVEGTAKAVKEIMKDEDGAAFLRKWAAIEAEFRRPLW